MKDTVISSSVFEEGSFEVECDSDDSLQSVWDDSLWIESMFAPRIAILQAVADGRVIGSGIGDTRHHAMMRCLSETSEFVAQRRLGAETRRGTPGFQHDGMASHRDPQTAKTHAYFEAEERRAIMQWWTGACGAHRIPEDWLRQVGLLDWMEVKRSTAFIRRSAQLWRVNAGGEIHVIICRTSYRNGQDPILGFGASNCAVEAAAHAMREALLMEVNLIEVLSARSGYSHTDTSAIEAKIAAYSDKALDLFPDTVADLPAERVCESLPQDLRPGTTFNDISFGDKRSVLTCTIKDSLYRAAGQETPFMNALG